MDFADRLDSEFNISASRIIGKEFRATCRVWLETYFRNVKRNTGRWVFNGFGWHAYSFEHEVAVNGEAAFAQYSSMPMERFFLFHESKDQLFNCSADHWPDLRVLEMDLYLFPISMSWTFVTTHEMSIGLGPYFATPPS